jgi:hypothetical protein
MFGPEDDEFHVVSDEDFDPPLDDDFASQWDDDPNPYAGTLSED